MVSSRGDCGLNIAELEPGSRGVSIVAKVVKKGDPYEIQTRYGPAVVSDAVLDDGSGTIGWRLWRDQVPLVKAGDTVSVENAFVRSFGDRKEINIGRDGRITVLKPGVTAK